MRILWLTENYFPNRGGMAQSCDRITYNLRQQGIQIDLVHFTKRRQGKEKELFNGYYLPVFPELDLSHTFNLLWKQLQERPLPDIIVIFGGSLPMTAGPIYAQWMERPLVTLIRGNDFDAGIFSPRKRDILLYALDQSIKIATVSQEKATKINLLIKKETANFLPNGLETDTWVALPSDHQKAQKWKKENVPKNKKVIGLFGHLKAKKGVSFFIKSLVALNYNEAFHFLIIGELESEIASLLMEGTISYAQLPFLDRNELIPYYLACDAVAIPSFYDGMPNVLLEAAAMGIPIIAARTDGMADVLAKDFNPFLFTVNSKDALAETMSYFLHLSTEGRQEIGKKLKTMIHQDYTQQLECSRYLELFESINSLK